MKKTRFTESQILSILKEAESGLTISELCRKHGVGESTFYHWRNKFGGMTESELKRLKQLEEENRRLKHMYAELSFDNRILKDVIEKNFNGH
jgi:putative transposase